MASARTKHLVLLVAIPITIAAATGLAQSPIEIAAPEAHDDHTRPEVYSQPTLPDELMPIPSEEPVQYPLAAAFNPAHASNYTAGGMIAYDYVVVHTMQGSYTGSQSWFQNPDANV